MYIQLYFTFSLWPSGIWGFYEVVSAPKWEQSHHRVNCKPSGRQTCEIVKHQDMDGLSAESFANLPAREIASLVQSLLIFLNTLREEVDRHIMDTNKCEQNGTWFYKKYVMVTLLHHYSNGIHTFSR